VGDTKQVHVTFHGVRGSTPCDGPTTDRYGGNTACVSVMVEGERPVLLDLGTGLRYFGQQFIAQQSTTLDAVALVSHLHWDHVQGLPFFAPMLRAGSRIEIYGPIQEDGSSFQSAMESVIRPPTFPVTMDTFPGKFEFHDVADNEFSIGNFRIMSRLVPHIGPTLGYRIEFGDVSIAYIPDHQQPYDGSFSLADGVRDLAQDVDLLIHDSQYTEIEFAARYNWGHCTTDFATAIANTCGARKVALFHHDPERTDDQLDKVSQCSRVGDTEVFVAKEGVTILL